MTTAVIALAGVESQACGKSMTPSDISTALSTPKRLLKIQPQTKAHTVEGSTQGSSDIARSAPRPRKRLVHEQRPAEPQHHGARRRSDDVDRRGDEGAEDGRVARTRARIGEPMKNGAGVSTVSLYSDSVSARRNGQVSPGEGDERGQQQQLPNRCCPAFSPRHPRAAKRAPGVRRMTSAVASGRVEACEHQDFGSLWRE